MMNEQILINLLTKAREIIEKYEKNDLEGEAKDLLKSELEEVRDELIDLQNIRIVDLTDMHQTFDNLPEEEYKVQKELTDLIVKINNLLGEEKW
jgi:hypothetical protein